MSKGIVNVREVLRRHPDAVKSRARWNAIAARVMDMTVWPLMACVYTVSKSSLSICYPKKYAGIQGPEVWGRLFSSLTGRQYEK